MVVELVNFAEVASLVLDGVVAVVPAVGPDL